LWGGGGNRGTSQSRSKPQEKEEKEGLRKPESLSTLVRKVLAAERKNGRQTKKKKKNKKGKGKSRSSSNRQGGDRAHCSVSRQVKQPRKKRGLKEKKNILCEKAAKGKKEKLKYKRRQRGKEKHGPLFYTWVLGKNSNTGGKKKGGGGVRRGQIWGSQSAEKTQTSLAAAGPKKKKT